MTEINLMAALERFQKVLEKRFPLSEMVPCPKCGEYWSKLCPAGICIECQEKIDLAKKVEIKKVSEGTKILSQLKQHLRDTYHAETSEE